MMACLVSQDQMERKGWPTAKASAGAVCNETTNGGAGGSKFCGGSNVSGGTGGMAVCPDYDQDGAFPQDSNVTQSSLPVENGSAGSVRMVAAVEKPAGTSTLNLVRCLPPENHEWVGLTGSLDPMGLMVMVGRGVVLRMVRFPMAYGPR